MKNIRIAGKNIGPGHKPFIIAEMSGNHNGSLDQALAIVDAVARVGADALKIQTYTAETMTLDLSKRDFMIKDQQSLWRGTSLYKLYDKAHTPWEWHRAIFERGRKNGLIVFSSPFDQTAIDFLEELNAPCYKIASFENVDLPLIRQAAATGKPLIISTGLASIKELDEAVDAAKRAGGKEMVLLKCTSSYPASPRDSNIMTIKDLQRRYDCQVGLSDHTIGIGAALASISLGACVIEKHFTLLRAEGGVDSAFSLEPAELEQLVRESKNAWLSLGKIKYGPTSQERKSLIFRRSLYVVQDISPGERFTSENVRSIRPGNGLPPKYYEKVIGKIAKKHIKRGTPLTRALVKGQI